MAPSIGLVARLAIAGLLAVALAVMPGAGVGDVAARSSRCPTPTIQRLVRDGSIPCYRSRTLTFRAYVQHPCTEGCGGASAYSIRPRWLDTFGGSYAILGSGPHSASLPAFVRPALGRCSPMAELRSCLFRPYEGHRVTVRARYNDPVARTCRYSEHPPGPGFTRKDAIAECSADLVVLSVRPAAPETDVAATFVPFRSADGLRGLSWLIAFSIAFPLAARWFPRRGRRTSQDRASGFVSSSGSPTQAQRSAPEQPR